MASTAAVPRINTGITKGRIIRAIKAPALFNPKVSALPIEPRRLRIGVPRHKVITSTKLASKDISNWAARMGEINIKINPEQTQCAAIFANTTRDSGQLLRTSCSSVPSCKSSVNTLERESIEARSALTQITPAEILRSRVGSGPIASGNKLATNAKKKMAAKVSVFLRRAK